MVTARDVARRAGVSTSTVSHVLNGTRGVSKELRSRVLAASEELAFEPSTIARSLKTNHSEMIGLIVPGVNPYFMDVLLGVEQVAERRGYSVIFCHSHEDAARERAYLRLLRGRRVDGIVLVPNLGPSEEIDRLIRIGCPLVLVDRGIPGRSIDLVTVDNEPAAYLGTRHLLDQGHTRIAMVTGDPAVYSSEPRVRGYRRAMAEAGLEFDDELVECGFGRTREGHEATLRLLSHRNHPTALMAGNDLMSIGALAAIQELGLRVPEDLAYVGFDELEWAGLVKPPLTTVAQPVAEIGRTAAELLLNRIEGDSAGSARRVALSATLMVRGSSLSQGPRASSSPVLLPNDPPARDRARTTGAKSAKAGVAARAEAG